MHEVDKQNKDLKRKMQQVEEKRVVMHMQVTYGTNYKYLMN